MPVCAAFLTASLVASAVVVANLPNEAAADIAAAVLSIVRRVGEFAVMVILPKRSVAAVASRQQAIDGDDTGGLRRK
jgi:hypothetical protein